MPCTRQFLSAKFPDAQRRPGVRTSINAREETLLSAANQNGAPILEGDRSESFCGKLLEA